jgi:hypothetical protein
MKNNKNSVKTKAIIIALFLSFTIAVPMFSLQPATADNHPYQVTTYAFCEVNPKPVGVGQEAFITFGIDKAHDRSRTVW